MTSSETINFIAKYIIVLISDIDFNIRLQVLVEYFEFIAYPYR